MQNRFLTLFTRLLFLGSAIYCLVVSYVTGPIDARDSAEFLHRMFSTSSLYLSAPLLPALLGLLLSSASLRLLRAALFAVAGILFLVHALGAMYYPIRILGLPLGYLWAVATLGVLFIPIAPVASPTPSKPPYCGCVISPFATPSHPPNPSLQRTRFARR